MMSSSCWGLVLAMVLSMAQLQPVSAQQQGSCGPGRIQLFNGVPCANDQACQRLSTGFFCLAGRCCANSVSPAGGYGSSCTNQGQCALADSQCVGNVCYCQNGFGFDGQQCRLENGFRLNDPASPNSVIGQCPPNEVLLGGTCYPLRSYYGACELNAQCDFPGAVCLQRQCKCVPGQIFNGHQCVVDQALPGGGDCGPGQTRANGACYPLAGLGERCVLDQQCQLSATVADSGIQCVQGVCTRVPGWQPRPAPSLNVQCRNSRAQVELLPGGGAKNCIAQSCAAGFHCEYAPAILQYVCCGVPAGQEGPFGAIKMYPGYENLPLQCFGVNSCTFVDFPYCVFSQSYSHNVCCSKPECV